MSIDVIARGIAASKVSLVDGKVPAEYLPSYVDEVIDAYIIPNSELFSKDWLSLTENGAALTPDKSKIYNILSAGEYQHFVYRWSGSSYIVVTTTNGEPYKITQATENILGGIKASPRTSEDTQEVKIDTLTGKLYVKPGSGTTSNMWYEEI